MEQFQDVCCEIIEKQKKEKTSIVNGMIETREQDISSLIFERCLVGVQLPSVLLTADFVVYW